MPHVLDSVDCQRPWLCHPALCLSGCLMTGKTTANMLPLVSNASSPSYGGHEHACMLLMLLNTPQAQQYCKTGWNYCKRLERVWNLIPLACPCTCIHACVNALQLTFCTVAGLVHQVPVYPAYDSGHDVSPQFYAEFYNSSTRTSNGYAIRQMARTTGEQRHHPTIAQYGSSLCDSGLLACLLRFACGRTDLLGLLCA